MATGLDLYPSIPLFPRRFRYVGGFLILCSLVAVYLYFWGGRPAFFEAPVFALVTSYAETRWLVIAQTNILDEIAVIFGIAGLILTAFSEEVYEAEWMTSLRVKALFSAVYITAGLLIFLYLVVFGWPIIALSAFVFILYLLIYLILFKSYLAKKKYFSKKRQEPSIFNIIEL